MRSQMLQNLSTFLRARQVRNPWPHPGALPLRAGAQDSGQGSSRQQQGRRRGGASGEKEARTSGQQRGRLTQEGQG